MPNSYFQFKQFTIQQDRCAMKVTTDACLFGAWVANEVKNKKVKVKNCLDIGAGTGLLSLMFAQKKEDAFIDAIEIDKETCNQAKENIDASPWKDRIIITNSDVKTFSFQKKYDLIISNPPFYENELKSEDGKRNTALHSNELRLAVLLNTIKESLSSTGFFYLLLPYKRNDEIKKMLLEKEMVILKMILVRQSVNHDYFRIMLSGKLKSTELTETTIDEISLWNDQQKYTKEFIELLKDYYLNL